MTSATKIVSSTNQTAASAVASAASSKCGASFADGQIPSSVSTGGSASASASANARSGAAGLGVAPVVAIAGAAMAVLAGGFAVLA